MSLYLAQYQFWTPKILQNEATQALTASEVKDFFLNCQSDFAFVFHKDGELVFGRDIFGRRSLIICGNTNLKEGEIEIRHGFNGQDVAKLENGQTRAEEVPVGTIFHLKNVPEPKITDTSFIFSYNSNTWENITTEIYTYYPVNPPYSDAYNLLNANVTHLDSTSYIKPSCDFSDGDGDRDFESVARKLIDEMKKATVDIFQPDLVIPDHHLSGPVNMPEQVSVSFSGGVDSLFVTVIAATVFPEVKQFNLINTLFGDTEEDQDKAHDRKKGREAFEWLCEYFGPKFSMIEVNVPREDIEKHRSTIRTVMYPKDTVLDESLASVVWFGSRGKGKQVFYKDHQGLEFKPSPFAFCGSGSDELLGGYARHRTYYEKGGWESLHEGLEAEICRIGERNFGRDDRITMSNGVALIAPFMHDSFVKWITAVPLPYRVDFREPRGIGEKKLLRVAMRLLGLPPHLTDTPKKAMQFGSGYVKQHSKGKNGADKLGVNMD
ncbi:unnamed protein product [Bursaphelenchus okinawaensis]|uniref:Asparagine synthetase domain-containing protein n=1 Tax=Bursaphelenchus okinawaensis TaxID=465554 RepID=A0A811LS54_9BILA|nr:unnamed protein product [Bursaphelenchus okinawaensis]CAG9127786.1 unnamed protein product [Bursaphelenchus okinawaensis]